MAIAILKPLFLRHVTIDSISFFQAYKNYFVENLSAPSNPGPHPSVVAYKHAIMSTLINIAIINIILTINKIKKPANIEFAGFLRMVGLEGLEPSTPALKEEVRGLIFNELWFDGDVVGIVEGVRRVRSWVVLIW
jgi:hypothetical protein